MANPRFNPRVKPKGQLSWHGHIFLLWCGGGGQFILPGLVCTCSAAHSAVLLAMYTVQLAVKG